MDSRELKDALAELALSQVELASLVDMTPRAVTLWVSGERGVPGAVEAYLRVLRALPPHLLQQERSHRKKASEMRDGVYTIKYQFQENRGVATLVFDHGQVFGLDAGNAKYDGGYEYDAATRLATAKVKVTFPKDGMTVFGIAHPFEWSIDVVAEFNPHLDAGAISVKTSLGHDLPATFEFGRPLPNAARPKVSEETRFEKRNMASAVFDDVNLAKATFNNINLQGTRFTDVNLSHVSIDDANIDGLTIFGIDVRALIQAELARQG